MEDFFTRYWDMLVSRTTGPFAFRFVLQPLTAAIIAFRAGLRDAREGRPAFDWALVTDRVMRHELLRQGWKELARVFVFAVVVDLIYEAIVFHWIYPGQALIVAALLAFLPYPLIRGTVTRVVRRARRSYEVSQVRMHPGASSPPIRDGKPISR